MHWVSTLAKINIFPLLWTPLLSLLPFLLLSFLSLSGNRCPEPFMAQPPRQHHSFPPSTPLFLSFFHHFAVLSDHFFSGLRAVGNAKEEGNLTLVGEKLLRGFKYSLTSYSHWVIEAKAQHTCVIVIAFLARFVVTHLYKKFCFISTEIFQRIWLVVENLVSFLQLHHLRNLTFLPLYFYRFVLQETI